MQLKWASKVAGTPKKVKSLAEIQAEEQERLAKVSNSVHFMYFLNKMLQIIIGIKKCYFRFSKQCCKQTFFVTFYVGHS